jgi:phage terminase large subunit-like protein
MEAKFDKDKAERVKQFIRARCSHTSGEWAGQRFVLLPWQEEIIDELFGMVYPDGSRQYRFCYIEIPKKNGKALHTLTPIPTVDGWKYMQDVRVGDTLFDENGEQCKVKYVTQSMYNHECYRVMFSDHTFIDCDAEHLWEVEVLYNNYKKKILTTEQMRPRYKVGKNGASNYRIAVHDGLKCKTVALPIEPYVLGIWLGDGNTNNAVINCHDKDIEIIDKINLLGQSTKRYTSPSYKNKCGAYLLGNGVRGNKKSIQAILRANGLLGNKHIPSIYQRANGYQRLELMRGLMDSDGYCDKQGNCEFTTTKPSIRDGFMELARGLGYKPVCHDREATLNGKSVGRKYRIQFVAHKYNSPFYLTRKHNRLRNTPLKRTRAKYRYIVNIKKIDSVPVKCITVDSLSQLYLAGDGMIPTHNTEFGGALADYGLIGEDEQGAEIYQAAADRDQAGLCYRASSIMVQNDDKMSKRFQVLDGRKRIIDHQTHSFIQVLSSESFTKHGLNPFIVLIDEIHAHPTRELYDVLTSGTNYARDGNAMGHRQLVIIMTTAGVYDPTSIWWEVRNHAIKVRDGVIEDKSFLPVLYIADPHKDDPHDEELWQRVNPSIGHIFSLDTIRADYKRVKDNPAEWNNFKRFRLNIPALSEAQWIPTEKWQACGGEVLDEDNYKGRVCFAALDLSSTTDLTALILVFPPKKKGEKFDILCRFFMPKDNIMARVKTDRVPYDEWVEQGLIQATPGGTVDHDFIINQLMQDKARFDIREIAFDRWGSAYVVQKLEDMGFKLESESKGYDRMQLVQFGQGYVSMGPAMKELEKILRAGNLQHFDNPVLRWNASNVYVDFDNAENMRPNKKKSTDRIDGIVALIMGSYRAVVHMGQPDITPSITGV